MADRRLLKDVTAIIKTFERPHALTRLLRSIQKFYPELRVIVGDGSFSPSPRRDVQYIRLPPDVGVSAGRNALLKRVDTPYFLQLDDDFEFTSQTCIEQLAAVVDQHPVHLAAGDCIDCKRRFFGYVRRKPSPYHGRIELEGDHLSVRSGCHCWERGYYRCDIVSQFFVAQCDAILAMGGWNELLKTQEHTEFFVRFQRHRLRAAYCPQVTLWHWCTRTANYAAYRNRNYLPLAARQMGITRWTGMDGQTWEFNHSEAA